MLNGITLSTCLSSLVKICLEILCLYQLYTFKIIVACCHTSFAIDFESEFQWWPEKYTVLLYFLQTALHVSDDTPIHNQEHTQTVNTTSGTGRTIFATVR